MKKNGIFWGFVVGFMGWLTALGWAQTTGTISGVIRDPSNARVAGANVTVTLQGTQITRVTTSSEDGTFELPSLPIGTYRLVVTAEGFKQYEQTNLEVSLGRVNSVTVRLEIGETSEVVQVKASGTPLVETESTQLGASVNSRAVVNLPLNTRDTYQFLQLQPGVQSQLGSDLFTGSDQPGVVSVNGGRGRSNNFSVNGGEANDLYVNLPAIQPSPDAIEEFRVLTNNFDAEYGRNSGSVINVVTKSGSDQFRGNVFEFFRNRVLNARNFFNLEKPAYNQHIFGGTFGGPIQRGRTYFFTSYEGRRIRQGIPSEVVPVPTAAERQGDFSAGPLFTGFIADATVAAVLNARPGCAAAVAAAGGAPIRAGAAYADIFPGNRIPSACFDRTANDLLQQFVPLPNLGDSFFQANPVARRRGDQGLLRLDHRLTDRQQLSAFLFYSDSFTFEPFARVADSGANLPGFGNLNNLRVTQINLSHTWTGTNTINEARAVYFRQNMFRFNSPERSNLVNASCRDVPPELCFSDPNNPRLGIIVGVGTPHEGVPWIGLEGGFSIGNNYQGEIPQVVNTYQLTNNLTRIWGSHTAKFGVDVRQQRYLMTNFGALNGQFSFFGGGPNNIGYTNLVPNYLLGLVDSYYQTGAQTSHFYSNAVYLFAQDSWKITPNVTLNYGLRWELNTPAADRFRRVQSFRAGLASTQFPCRLDPDNPLVGVFGSQDCSPTGPARAVFPLGLGIPGDEGVPDGLFRTYYRAFAPRLGLAWSPPWQSGWLAKLTGGPGNSSVRAGWGMFYNGPIEGLILAQLVPQPPFGISSNITNTFLSTPFLRQDGTIVPNPSNGILNPRRGDPVDYSVFRPILLYGQLPAELRPQYSVQYSLTLQRKLQDDLLVQVGYVGTQGHRLLLTRDINFGNPQTCLDLNRILGPGTCGPFGADNEYFVPAGAIPAGVTLHLPYGPQRTVTGPNNPAIRLVGLRPFSSPFCNPLTGEGCPPDGVPVFASLFERQTAGNSNYHSLQVLVDKRFEEKGIQIQAAYTWSKSIDNASSFENIVNPINPRLSRSLSLFDARHRLVVTFDYRLPKVTGRRWLGGILNNWAVSGIAVYQTGFPIRITSSDDLELMNSFDFELPGQPDLVGRFRTFDPRRNNLYFFDPTAFAPQELGTIGNAPRTICCGPSIHNYDVTLRKNIPINERLRVEFRSEFYNVFNQTQFLNPRGNITEGENFGRVTRARDPRQIQFALKLFF